MELNMAAVLEQPLELTGEEIARITGYRRATKQLDVLASLGIPARRRPDNSVLVLRMHCLYPMSAAPAANPSANEPQLRPIRQAK
ncbi:DUF4224 domain-containing protein [Pandoraea apista]|uniref:DUF4224 domain-containing protein n=2 Tax=Pandoraea apista TaxID=93218 RepID=A0ABX9ZKQ2_9BURK|nr:hypothetical protein C7830_11380 [Pandoraea apista]RRJ30793.1 DUF4224 domain-containing protein [Pandoraea apista]RRJ74579.1 DUF4224 domain-containing protein [Pandoraea apista]RSD06385.1 DUF4224 domain-containing protein [Pandoraea apista]RSD14538.1 DUF4224 domain-containing protein [Pandoraea apista]